MELQDQLRLEDDLILQGAERYMKNTASAEEGGRAADTGYGQRLLTTLIKPVAEELEVFCNDDAKKHGKYKKLIQGMDYEVVAYIGLKTILHHLGSKLTVTQVGLSIGLHLEDEQRFAAFKQMNPEYYAVVMRDFNKKNTKAYRHMRNVLAVTSKKKGLQWDEWSKNDRLGIGVAVLDKILKVTDIIEVRKKRLKNGKYSKAVVPTLDALEWISGYNEYASVLHPYTKPCIIPPDEWQGLENGGYWSEAMRTRNPLIKGLKGSEKKFVSDHNLDKVTQAVNALQNVQWEVNSEMVDVLATVWDSNKAIGLPKKEPVDIPKFRDSTPPKEMDPDTFQEFLKWKGEVAQLYTDEISRASKAYEVSRIIAMARAYQEYDGLWFVYQCDFRGRVYASSAGLNPQGSDFNRAMLRFKEGKALGDNGLYWLAVHGANCFGVDKVSFDDRVDWVHANVERIQAVAKHPMSHTDFWGEADYPFMFVAFCLEYAQAVENPTGFISHLPVGMDGSCNGLQNFSALLRDSVGGQATNLTPGDKPSDIYQQVADRAKELLDASEASDEKDLWLAFIDKHGGLSRKIAKRPVMTLPYGCTKYACLGFIDDAVREIDMDFFEDRNMASQYMTELIWAAIHDVVVSAREAMDWLQKIASMTANRNLPVWWINPVGFPVYQSIKKIHSTQVRTMLMGDVRLRLNKETDVISKEKQMQGIAPNFVHSLDSAHMMLTVLEAQNRGITNFSMIHDDFGTHAADVEQFRNVIRETFVTMYIDNNPLEDLYMTTAMSMPNDCVPPMPDSGDLDIREVLNSEYFFA